MSPSFEYYSVKAPGVVKDPTTYSTITYVWVALLSAWGGVIRYLNSIRGREVPFRRVLFELLLSCSTSIFVGVITFYLCEAASFEPLWTAVCVAVTGHMGAESLTLLRNIVKHRLSSSNVNEGGRD